ncbi:MAG TPA: transcriptional regulator [Pseudomonadales bacterium]|jgi:DNA-binding MarR family transcriptional regulator|nr:transcriptional regulator [Pseudomonadales bacterium]
MADRTRNRSTSGAKRRARGNARSKKPEFKTVIGHLRDEGGAEVFRLVNERVRLGILSALAVTHSLSFADLKQTLGVTDGNLSIHARKLEESQFIVCEKTFQDRRPLTQYTLTPKGRAAFERYLGHMEALIEAMRKPK